MILHVPAEWEAHRRIWTAWPSAGELWLENLEPARAEVAAMIKALAADYPLTDAPVRKGDAVTVLAAGDEAVASARAALGNAATIVDVPFGDIWLRDTGPIFARDGVDNVALRFQTNGWGGKYDLAYDDTVGDAVAALSGAPVLNHTFVLEGGAIEHDGQGTVLTTRQCVLNPNRNADWDEASAEKHFRTAFGAKKVFWLGDGLVNDHTDGHVDNIARFVAPGHVACQSPFGVDDPNAEILLRIAADLASMTDGEGRSLSVHTIPSPGLVRDDEDEIVPASHMNFIIGNATVVVPLYGANSSDEALRSIAALFPTRRVVGIQSLALLTGGGSFHCITQQEPMPS